MVALPGEAQAGRDFAIVLPRITHRLALFGLTKRAAARRRLGLQVFDLSDPPAPADPFNPNFHIKPLSMGVTAATLTSESD